MNLLRGLVRVFATKYTRPLTVLDIAVVVAVSSLGEVLLSLLFYEFHLRERPIRLDRQIWGLCALQVMKGDFGKTVEAHGHD